jgi:hypothetical protein
MKKAAAIWICCCAYLNCAGWILSALHELNSAGYIVATILGIAALAIWRKKTSENFLPQIRWKKLFRRFKKIFPLAFLIVAALEFVGGAIYPPNNYDALTYRLPRILNWLAAGHWTWISTLNERMNWATPGWEWIAAPFFALFHSDRGLFLIDATGFVLMPGLLFTVFRRVGIARRVAWTWMWILPLAYGFALQAGSVGNDFIGAIFALAAIAFGLRARQSKKNSDVWLAIFSAALMTNAKLSNLPLLLPCLVAVWPSLKLLRKKIAASFAVMCVASLISAAPIMILNQINTGSWNGDPKNVVQVQIKSPEAGIFGNGLLLLEQSFMPPVLPDARGINEAFDEKMPASWQRILKEKFPRFYLAGLNELPQEESAGLGIGVTLLLLAGVGATIFGAGRKMLPAKIFSASALIGGSAWIAALAYMAKMGSEATARLMLPYYSLLIIPILLLPSHNWLLKFRAWKIFAALCALSVLPAIILSPSRPLLPMEKISAKIARQHPDSATAQRLATVYSAYAHRNDALAPLRAGLPDGVLKIGFFGGGNDTDYSLWRPFGSRQVEYLLIDADKSIHIPDDVEWIVVKRAAWSEATDLPLETWAAQHRAKITLSVSIVTLVSWGEQTWCVLHVEKP